jgi:hypothetical protein
MFQFNVSSAVKTNLIFHGVHKKRVEVSVHRWLWLLGSLKEIAIFSQQRAKVISISVI